MTHRSSTSRNSISPKSMKRSPTRRGALTIEMAFCLPILLLIILGAVEFSRMNMLRNSIDNAAYEAARRGVVPGATASDCVSTAAQVLTVLGARNTTVTVTPNPIVDDTTQVSVTISTPIASNSWGPARFLGNVTLRATSTKSREFVGQLVPNSVP